MRAQKKQQQSMILKFWDFYNNKIIMNLKKYQKGTAFQMNNCDNFVCGFELFMLFTYK